MALYKRGSTYWASFTAPDGTRVRCSTGTSDRQKAQEFFDKLKHESWRVSRMGEKPRRTWDDAALLWIKEKADKRSIADDISMLRGITPFFRGRYLDEITRPMIAAFGEKKKAESSPSRANRYLTLIRSILNRAVRIWEWIDKAPTVSLYPEPKLRVRYLSAKEVQRVLDELPAHQKPIFLFSILTGLRKSNVLNLRWNQVDFLRNVITFSAAEMKAGRVHTIPISDAVRNILIAQKGKNLEYVFSYKGQPIRDIGKGFRKALERAGITDYRWHDNRHTWASIIIQNGVPLNELQEMGGWSCAEMVSRYAHLAPEKLKKNAEVVSGFLKDSVTILSQFEKTDQ